jgi:flagellar biosynthesis/type III secretory pathway protein FliH
VSFKPIRPGGTGFEPLIRGSKGSFAPLRAGENAGPDRFDDATLEHSLEVSAELEEATVGELSTAREEAYEDGYRKGVASARDELSDAMDTASNLVRELQGARSRVFEGSRNDLIDLLGTCLDWLHLTTIAADRELVVRVIDAVLEDFGSDVPLTIRLNPRDQQILADEIEAGEKPWSTWDLTLLPDRSVEPGGCVVDAPEGRVDATVTERLSRLGAEVDLLRAAPPADGEETP